MAEEPERDDLVVETSLNRFVQKTNGEMKCIRCYRIVPVVSARVKSEWARLGLVGLSQIGRQSKSSTKIELAGGVLCFDCSAQLRDWIGLEPFRVDD
jgi:hypothetical protein